MTYNILPIASDHEVTVNLDDFAITPHINVDTPVLLRVDEESSSLFPCVPYFDPHLNKPIDVKTDVQVGEGGVIFSSAIWFYLDLTVKELFAGLKFETVPPADGTSPHSIEAKAYVDVLLCEGHTFLVTIYSRQSTIHIAEYKNYHL